MRILVVDDTTFMRQILKNTLSELGHQVIGEAENGIEAIEMYKSLEPDMVTMDITMAKMNGLEALKRIRDYDSEAKVIMCSSLGQQGTIIESMQYGALDFIVKPFTSDRVSEVMNQFV